MQYFDALQDLLELSSLFELLFSWRVGSVESLPEAFPRWCVVFCGGKISCPSDNILSVITSCLLHDSRPGKDVERL